MISVLCEPGTENSGTAIAAAIADHYTLPALPTILSRSSQLPDPATWDDVLIVIFRTQNLPPWEQDVVAAFRHARPLRDPGGGAPRPGGFVLPLALDPAATRPPAPISGIKAAVYDGSGASTTKMLDAIGVLLGQALRPSNHHIFISYRSTDGSAIAAGLEDELKAAGFHPWRDEAPENLPPTTDVQDEIAKQIALAAMILIVDTPDAVSSHWIEEEINLANGQLIPVLPIVVGSARVSRFLELKGLQRCATVKPAGVDGQPLSDAEWGTVKAEIEQLLLSGYRRRLRTVFAASQAFIDKGFDWTEVDLSRRMYSAKKAGPAPPATVVLSHCSIHDPDYVPALRTFSQFIRGYPEIDSVNYKICIYDRDEGALKDPEMRAIDRLLGRRTFILAHYEELRALIGSNFIGVR
jgi:hypothetical protein